MWSDRRMAIYRRARTGWHLSRSCLVAGITVLLASAGAITGTAYASTNSIVPPPVFDKPCAGNKFLGPFTVAGTQVFSASTVRTDPRGSTPTGRPCPPRST
jgi:hypothetical protein